MARDPQRIFEIALALIRVWQKVPELRLGQMLDNAIARNTPTLFYVEDADLIARLQLHYDHPMLSCGAGEMSEERRLRKENESLKKLNKEYLAEQVRLQDKLQRIRETLNLGDIR